MKIAGHDLHQKILIVAEIGNNHEGRFDVATEMIRKASECGVDAVKFQTFKTRFFVSAADRSRYERLSSFELTFPQFEALQCLAKSLGLLFLSTPLDLESARFLKSLVDGYKIASGDNNFYPLLEEVCKTEKPIIVSSGLSDLAQITRCKKFIENQWRMKGISQGLAFLHCVSCYPVPVEQANLSAIPFLSEKLGCIVGYSDHSLGLTACLAAAALGARIIEKHFTLDKNYSSFRDHQLSADPTEMKRLVEEIGRVSLMLGKSEKTIQLCESDSAFQVRRSIVAADDLHKGHCISSQDLIWTRPAIGLPPGEEDRIIGLVLKRELSFGEPILISDLE